MNILLTAESVHNPTIAQALRDLLPRPSADCAIAYITTSQNAATGDKSWFVGNLNDAYNLGWKSFYIIDVAAMIDLPKSMWWDRIESADVIFMGGGANFYLSYWLERSGLMDALPRLLEDKVYVGSSAGSMVLTQSLLTASNAMQPLAAGEPLALDQYGPEGQRSSRTLGLVDFIMRPHYGVAKYPYINDQTLQQAADLAGKTLYAIDNDSAIKVVGDTVEVVSEGQWKQFTPQGDANA